MLRPLLDFRKAELEEYCQRRGLDYVVDPTNAELSFHRWAQCTVVQGLVAAPSCAMFGNLPAMAACSTVACITTPGMWHQPDYSRSLSHCYCCRNRIRHVLQQVPTLPAGPDLGLATSGVAQPPAATTLQQGEPASQLSSSSSSHSSSSSSRVEQQDSTSSSGAPMIVGDILRLQRRCQAAAEQQRVLAGALLRRAVLHASSDELPCAPPKRPPRPGQRMTQAQLKRQWLEQQPWFLNWDKRLAQVGLQRMLTVWSQEATCVPNCISTGLHRMASCPYPAAFPQSIARMSMAAGIPCRWPTRCAP